MLQKNKKWNVNDPRPRALLSILIGDLHQLPKRLKPQVITTAAQGGKAPGLTQIEEMSEPFNVQISSDLIRRLLGEEDQKPTRKPKPKVVRPEHPSNQGRRIEPKPSEETGGWQSGLPSLLPLGVLAPVADKELDSIRKVINESEGVIDKLHKKEARALEEVNRNAKELREKEYKMPEQRTIPCLSAKDACVQCYKDHPEDPLQCAEAVKAFSDCARRVQQQFIASG